MNSDDRLERLIRWVRQLDGLADADPVPASVDASFRRYFRVRGRQSYVVMDAPPGQEDTGRFVRVAGYLHAMKLNAPEVIEADLEQGFLLLTDLGSTQYLGELESNPASAEALYNDAIDALLTLQSGGRKFLGELPPYDETLLRFELSIFREWLCGKHLGLEFSASEASGWQSVCDALVRCALDQPVVFVHRDYHSRNLMVTEENNPGILDFQDAVAGPCTYDLVSLLKDCYIEWPAEFVAEKAARFVARCGQEMPRDRFMRDLDWMGVQRHLKAAGIFARLLHRDGRSGYLGDIPRTLGYVLDVAAAHDELDFLASFVGERVLPLLEASS